MYVYMGNKFIVKQLFGFVYYDNKQFLGSKCINLITKISSFIITINTFYFICQHVFLVVLYLKKNIKGKTKRKRKILVYCHIYTHTRQLGSQHSHSNISVNEIKIDVHT